MKKKPKRHLKTRRGGASWMDSYMPSSKSTSTTTSTTTPTPTPTTTTASDENKTQGFSKSSDYSAYVKNTLKANRSAFNMPVTLAAINSKVNALLIHNKVNYKFSNGYTARDYNIEKIVAESSNEGRGELIPNSARGRITGAQSGIYNKGMEARASQQNKSKPLTTK
jgi:hypothetical protein